MITLHPIRMQDVGWARNLRNKNRQYFPSAEYIAKEKEQAWFIGLGDAFFVIWKDKKRVGTVSFRMGAINNVIIDEPYRRKGIFREAVRIIKKMYPQNPIIVEVEWDNQEAVRAYMKTGFRYKRVILELP